MAVLATAQITITDLLDGESAVLHSLATNVTSIQYDSLESLMIPSSVDISAQVKTGSANPIPFGAYFLVYEQSRNSLTVDEYTALIGKSGTVVGEEYVLSDTPYPYVLRYASQSTETELNYEIQTNAMGLYIEMYADSDYSELLGMQTIPIVTDGFTSYMWVMYADDANGSGISSNSEGKRYVGMAENQTVITPSTDPSKYRWAPLYDNVKIGVRNLLKLSDENVSTNAYLVKSYYMSETMVAGEDYTISIKGELLNGQTQWGIYLNGGMVNLVNIAKKSGMSIYTARFKGLSSGYLEDFINVYNMPNNASVAKIEWIQLEKGNVASSYSQAPEDTKAEINELSSSLGTLKNTTLPALEDDLLNKAEQESVKQSLNIVEAEKLDVDNQYTIIYGNASLTGTPKTNLYNAKVAYNTAHTNLKNAITAVVNVAEGTRISAALITAVSTSFTNYSSAIATLRTRVEEANKSILDKQILDTSTTLSTNITNVSNATTALQNFTNTTFTDGVIQRAESKAIAEHLNTLTKENVDLINQYNTLNGNVLLTGTPKTNLGSAKTSYDTAYSALTTAINTAIADGKVTSTESTSVATSFTAYGNSLKVFTQRLNEAVTAIADAASKAYTNSTVDTKTGRNMWVANKYEWANAARIFPKLSHIRGLKPSESKYMSDATSFTFSADYYIGHFYTYVYVGTAKTLNLTITHDDDCTIVVNDTEIYTSNATIMTATALAIPLKKGWNQIDMLLHEISGGDSIVLSALISSQVDDMSCYLGGGMSASQIRQLSDEIDLRVQRAGVINAINVSTEGIRLDGSKITINGNTIFGSDVIMANGVIRSADGGTVLDLNNNTFSINKPFTIGSSTSATTTQVTSAQTTAISTAASDATTKANTALSSAQSYAVTQASTALSSAQAYADTMTKVLTIDNTESTYFSFDKNLTASSGISPIAGYDVTLIEGGKFGKAVSNVGQKLHYDKSVLPLSTFTMSGWFKPILIHTEQAGNAGINGNWWFPLIELATPTNTSCVFSLSVEPDQGPTYNRRLKLQGALTGGGSTQLSNGVWYLVTVTFDGARYKVYLNGELEMNIANSTVLAPTAASVLMVGGGFYGKPNVVIDDFVVSSNAFTQEEIRAIYTLQQPMRDPSPRIIAPTPSGITISIS